MKKLIAGLVIFSVVGFSTAVTGINDKERREAVNYLKETRKFLVKEIRGLSESQLNWKPADSVWSIANCVEHITLSEKNLFDWAKSTLSEAADPGRRSKLPYTDDGIKKMFTDRSRKAKAQEGFIPTGQFGNAAATLQVFTQRREALINYVKTTGDQIRHHFAESPAGLMDTYQLLLLIAAHGKRHTLQIVELKSMPGFPKN